MSSYQLAKELGITQKSGWYMETNIRLMFGNRAYAKMLTNIVEIDEVYMVRDVSVPTKQGHGTNKQKVFGMRERNSEQKESGEIRITIVDKVDSKTLHPIIIDNVKLGSWLMSDEWRHTIICKTDTTGVWLITAKDSTWTVIFIQTALRALGHICVN